MIEILYEMTDERDVRVSVEVAELAVLRVVVEDMTTNGAEELILRPTQAARLGAALTAWAATHGHPPFEISRALQVIHDDLASLALALESPK